MPEENKQAKNGSKSAHRPPKELVAAAVKRTAASIQIGSQSVCSRVERHAKNLRKEDVASIQNFLREAVAGVGAAYERGLSETQEEEETIEFSL